MYSASNYLINFESSENMLNYTLLRSNGAKPDQNWTAKARGRQTIARELDLT